MLSFFPRDVLDEIWNRIKSVPENFPTYSYSFLNCKEQDSYIGVGRFRILGGQGLEYWGGGRGKGGPIPSRHMTSY